MKKNLLIGLLLTSIVMFMCSGCAQNKILKIDGVPTMVEPYGWMNEDARKIDGVVYELSAGSVIFSIIFSETIIVPIYLTGTQLYEPIRTENKKEKPTTH